MKPPTLTLLLALLPAAVAAPQAPGQKPSFPAQTEVVTVDVVVTGRGGEPVLDLRREDFTVTEDGVPQEIVAFDAVHRPAPGPRAAGAPPVPPEPRTSSNRETPGREAASFVIVFDELHLDPAEAVRARKAVADFLTTGVADAGPRRGRRARRRAPAGRPGCPRGATPCCRSSPGSRASRWARWSATS